MNFLTFVVISPTANFSSGSLSYFILRATNAALLRTHFTTSSAAALFYYILTNFTEENILRRKRIKNIAQRRRKIVD